MKYHALFVILEKVAKFEKKNRLLQIIGGALGAKHLTLQQMVKHLLGQERLFYDKIHPIPLNH